MTAWIWLIYKKIISSGKPASFKKENTLAYLFYGLYLLLGLASVLWSTNPGYSMLQLIMNLESLAFVVIFVKTIVLIQHYFPEIKLTFAKIFGPAVFLILLGFVIGLYIDPDTFYRLTHGGEEARLGGFLMNPNELGMLAVVGMSCCIINVFDEHHKKFNIFMLLVMLYALILTGSRSSLIGFFLIVFYFVLKSKNNTLKISILIGAILAIPVVVQTIFIKQGDIEEVLSMTGRLPFWKALLTEGLPKQPYFGFGFMRIANTESFQSVHTYAGKMTHNTFIQVLMNLGFVGFTIVLLQMTFTLRGFFKSNNKEIKTFFVGVFIPILINSFTEFGIFGETNYGILFYQFLILIFVFSYDENLSLKNKIALAAGNK